VDEIHLDVVDGATTSGIGTNMQIVVSTSGQAYVYVLLPVSDPIRRLPGTDSYPADTEIDSTFHVAHLAADTHGYYVLNAAPGNPPEGYVQAFDEAGGHRFRWPPAGSASGLVAIAADADRLWIVEVSSSLTMEVTRIHEIDVRDGELARSVTPESLWIFWPPHYQPVAPYFEVVDGVGYVGGVADGDFERSPVAIDLATGQSLPFLVEPSLVRHFMYSHGRNDRMYRVASASSSPPTFEIHMLREARIATSWRLRGDAFPQDIAVGPDGSVYVLSSPIGVDGGVWVDVYEP